MGIPAHPWPKIQFVSCLKYISHHSQEIEYNGWPVVAVNSRRLVNSNAHDSAKKSSVCVKFSSEYQTEKYVSAFGG